jgi:hypothetical protein
MESLRIILSIVDNNLGRFKNRTLYVLSPLPSPSSLSPLHLSSTVPLLVLKALATYSKFLTPHGNL